MKRQGSTRLFWLLGLGALVLYASRRSRAQESFRGHSVVITGGSRGLGLELARRLALEGAHVCILARDREELDRAEDILKSEARGSAHVLAISCDVTEPKDLKSAIQKTAKVFGGLDLLINNAGSILVGPWETMTQQDFEAQMKLHVYAPMNAVREALPFLRAKESGKRIVNICSMGGRVAVPHMLPYDTSKFALAGFSQGLGAELAPEKISVTTIYPALMRTGSPIQAVFKGDHEKEFAWFQAGDVMPGFSLSVESASKQIIEAARARRWELMPSLPAKIRMVAAAFFPETVGRMMGLMGALLPKGTSKRYKTGADSRARFDSSMVTKPLRRRAHRVEVENNQVPKHDAKFNLGLH